MISSAAFFLFFPTVCLHCSPTSWVFTFMFIPSVCPLFSAMVLETTVREADSLQVVTPGLVSLFRGPRRFSLSKPIALCILTQDSLRAWKTFQASLKEMHSPIHRQLSLIYFTGTLYQKIIDKIIWVEQVLYNCSSLYERWKIRYQAFIDDGKLVMALALSPLSNLFNLRTALDKQGREKKRPHSSLSHGLKVRKWGCPWRFSVVWYPAVVFVLCSISDFSETLHCLCIGWLCFVDHLPFRMMTFWFSWLPVAVEKVNCDKKGYGGSLRGEPL